MSINAHISELEKRHQAIERELGSLKNHPSADASTMKELKQKKLRLKDELALLNIPEIV